MSGHLREQENTGGLLAKRKSQMISSGKKLFAMAEPVRPGSGWASRCLGFAAGGPFEKQTAIFSSVEFLCMYII